MHECISPTILPALLLVASPPRETPADHVVRPSLAHGAVAEGEALLRRKIRKHASPGVRGHLHQVVGVLFEGHGAYEQRVDADARGLGLRGAASACAASLARLPQRHIAEGPREAERVGEGEVAGHRGPPQNDEAGRRCDGRRWKEVEGDGRR